MKKDRSYINKVLNGEKPMSVAFFLDLPVQVQAHVAKQFSESFGLLVVPPVSKADAVMNLVSGLFGLLAQGAPAAMPERGRMVRIERPEMAKRRSA